MRLTADRAFSRLENHDHAILCTVHSTRGVDAVPVVYAVHGDHVGIPIDLVKPKTSTHLQRERNLEEDSRATLLVEHWDPADWSRLWWVRAQLVSEQTTPELADVLGDRLSAKYVQYQDRPFARILLLRIVEVTGWHAAAP